MLASLMSLLLLLLFMALPDPIAADKHQAWRLSTITYSDRGAVFVIA
jgi:hypothetical protein